MSQRATKESILHEIMMCINVLADYEIVHLYNREFSRGCQLRILGGGMFEKVRCEGKDLRYIEEDNE